MKHQIRVKPDGTVLFIYDDKLRGLLTQGAGSVKRASHVEPGDPNKGQDPLRWYADMSPAGGPVLSSCDTREAALRAEVEWLEQHKLEGVHDAVSSRH